MRKLPENRYYVYEHWRPDRGECFYVGKGVGYRANDMKNSRNPFHKAIQGKLRTMGMCVEVKLIATGLTNDEAITFEIERIAFWKADGADLANMQPGGEGAPKGNKYRLGAVLSDETKAKIGDGNRGKIWTEEELARLSEACMGEKNGFFGKTHSEETRQKVAESNRRRVWTEESKKKLSETQKRMKPPKPKQPKVYKRSHEVVARMTAAQRERREREKNAAQ